VRSSSLRKSADLESPLDQLGVLDSSQPRLTGNEREGGREGGREEGREDEREWEGGRGGGNEGEKEGGRNGEGENGKEAFEYCTTMMITIM